MGKVNSELFYECVVATFAPYSNKTVYLLNLPHKPGMLSLPTATAAW